MSELSKVSKREPIIVEIPAVLCEVTDCERIRQSDMVVFFKKEEIVQHFQVCGHHVFLWKGFAPAAFFPLNKSPSLAWIADQIRTELARRKPRSPSYNYTGFSSFGFNGTGTGNYTMNFRFN